MKKLTNLEQIPHCAKYSSGLANVFKAGSCTISAAATGISAGGASCIPSRVPRMPIGGPTWIRAGIFTGIGVFFGAWEFAAPAGLFGTGGLAAPAGLFGAWRFAAPAALFRAWRFATPAGFFGSWTFAGACWTRTGIPGINIGRARWFIAEIFAGG